jgi:hypothetical protein
MLYGRDMSNRDVGDVLSTSSGLGKSMLQSGTVPTVTCRIDGRNATTLPPDFIATITIDS